MGYLIKIICSIFIPQIYYMADYKRLQEICNPISESEDADVFLFSGRIIDDSADELINAIRAGKKRNNCILILTTNGGDPDAGFRMVRCIHSHYKKFTLYVFGACKSTGTLISVGADKIIMGDLAEFGPLDIQLSGGDELSNTSGLSYLQSLISLNERIYNSFEQNFMELKAYGITTKTAAEIGSKLAIGIIDPIASQIDPLKLGDAQRAIKIASHYGERMTRNMADMGAIRKLITDYPSHSFVIDFKEMKDLFKNKEILRPDANEALIEMEFYGIVRTSAKKHLILHIGEKIVEDGKEDNDTEGEGDQKTAQPKTEPNDVTTQQPTNGQPVK